MRRNHPAAEALVNHLTGALEAIDALSEEDSDPGFYQDAQGMRFAIQLFTDILDSQLPLTAGKLKRDAAAGHAANLVMVPFTPQRKGGSVTCSS